MKNYLTEIKKDKILSELPVERQENILDIKNKLNLSYQSTLEFGSEASRELNEFSSELLESFKLKDTPEIEGLLTSLMGELKKVDSNTLISSKPSFLKKLFRVDDLKSFILRFEDVSAIISEVKNKLSAAEYELRKDIDICEKYHEQNLSYINELDDYIFAGQLKYDEETEKLNNEIEELNKNANIQDDLQVQLLETKKSALYRLEKKLYDLKLIRASAIQNIPQIQLIKEGDAALVEKIQSSINAAIPLWEKQMVTAIQLVRQKGALEVQKAVSDTTNKLITVNSELLKINSIEIAKEMQAGIIDIEVLKKSSETLINTIGELNRIRIEGEGKRAKATEELAMLQSNLNKKLLEQTNK